MANRLDKIDRLEEDRMDALERTKAVQAKRKEVYNKQITLEKRLEEGGPVVDSRNKNFSCKLHTRWMGPFRVDKIYSNGSLQLLDLGGNPSDTRVNRFCVKLY